MNKSSEVRHGGYHLSSHQFADETTVYFESSPGKPGGWYFTDDKGALFGPIRDESTARKLLAELSAWFNGKKV